MNEGDPENREHWVQIITTIHEILSTDHSFNLTTDKKTYVASIPILLKNMWIFMECSEIDIWINYSGLERLTT